MGYFDNLFYMGGGAKKLPCLTVYMWRLTSDSQKPWYNYNMRRKNFSNLAKYFMTS